MRKLVAGAFTSLDGVVQAPGGPDEDRDGGFLHGGWLVPYFDDHFARAQAEWTARAGAFVLGRKTYEMFAASWPNATDPADAAATALNRLPKYVATRTLTELSWNNSHRIEGDIAAAVRALKAQDGGEIQVHGSGNLLQTLFQHDLVDTLRIWQFPVILGSGKRLFAGGTIPLALRHVESDQTPAGAVLHVYERVGPLRYGEVEVGEPVRLFD
ncbi:MAG: dihydrofolate reductase family protein [Dehalococcoidia bacterium]